MGMIINSMKGIYLCVPRNMVQAAGMYNTLLAGDDPAIVVECLNGYRLKEAMPRNLGEYRVALGQVEILRKGNDVTLVTYGSCVREAIKAVDLLNKLNISVELIDVQTLMPFDLERTISASVKKTNRIVFLDEDVPGGATAFMMREVIEVQGAYYYLDAKPRCISAKEHRTPFGSDGDYFTKPTAEDVVEEIVKLMEQ
jgi:pyruvate/2-oxoglutarate/acetoin dehydrogenase E1 component